MAKARLVFLVSVKSVGRRRQPLAPQTKDSRGIFEAVIYIIGLARHEAGWPWVDSYAEIEGVSSRELFFFHQSLTIFNVKTQLAPRVAA